jgi:hypothetical protein
MRKKSTVSGAESEGTPSFETLLEGLRTELEAFIVNVAVCETEEGRRRQIAARNRIGVTLNRLTQVCVPSLEALSRFLTVYSDMAVSFSEPPHTALVVPFVSVQLDRLINAAPPPAPAAFSPFFRPFSLHVGRFIRGVVRMKLF